jgi:hypothetical protein
MLAVLSRSQQADGEETLRVEGEQLRGKGKCSSTSA